MKHGSHENPPAHPRFHIVDVLLFTGIVALHFAAYHGGASESIGDWHELLCFAPTAVTCLIHLRLRLTTATAMVVHYTISLAWSFLHSIGKAVFNNPYIHQEGVQYHIDWHAYLWRETSGMAVLGIVWAAAYGLICYTALHVNRTGGVEQSQQKATGIE